MSFLDKLLRIDARRLKKIERIADKVLSYEDEMAKLSDEELKNKTPYFKDLLSEGQTLDDILPEAFAVVREMNFLLKFKLWVVLFYIKVM